MTRVPPDHLPDGFAVALNPRVRAYDRGRTLVGGAPVRAVFLGDAARLLLTGAFEVRDGAARALAQRLLHGGLADPVLDRLPDADLADLTVVIPVRDRAASLARLLDALGETVRVIVVDDASEASDAIADVCVSRGAGLVRSPVNVGPAGARNLGLRHAGTRYVAFVDSDVVVDVTTLRSVMRHFHDPSVALAAPRIVGLEEGSWLGRYESVGASMDRGAVPSLVRPHAAVAWLPGACLLARVEALGQGFGDSRVAEDVDLVWRLAAQGWRVRYEPSECAAHDHRTRLGPWLLRKAFYGTGARALGQRHGGAVAPAVLAPWSAALALCLLAQRRWSAPAAACVFAAATVRLASRLHGSDHRYALAARLSARGGAAALSQTSALLLRHWWPVAVLGAVRFRRLRRAVVIAAVADTALEYRRTGPPLDPVRFAVARRLDDLAYGAGVWWGCIRGRSFTALLPLVRPPSRGSRPPGEYVRQARP